MSADLFAEFNEIAKSPPSQGPQPGSRPPAGALEKDFFGVLSTTNSSANPAPLNGYPPQQWNSSSTKPSGFGDWAQTPSKPPVTNDNFDAADDDDGWGDFETAEAGKPVQVASQPAAWKPGTTVSAPEPTRTRIIRADTMDLMTNNLVNLDIEPAKPPVPDGPKPNAAQPKARLAHASRDPNVLFDADDFELEGGEDDEEDGDDEFGDFETTTVTHPSSTQKTRPPARPAPATEDLLGFGFAEPVTGPAKAHSPVQNPGLLSFGSTAGTYPQAPKSPSFQERNPFPELAVAPPLVSSGGKSKSRSPSPVTAWPSGSNKVNREGSGKAAAAGFDDDWGAWDEPSLPVKQSGQPLAATQPPDDWSWGQTDTVQETTEGMRDLAPPVNVPPPSIIISIFPELLGSVSRLFSPMGSKGASIKDRILSDPKIIDFLKAYLLLVATAAHVIAGRKQRWHRDKILAKSMSISAAGSKGMKLAGVDKTQATREDREAADVIACWREHVGRLRSAVAAANSLGRTVLRVPELKESMHVQTAKLVPTAVKPCVICGLKREERIASVDHEVEDSFGEWWIEHWGHRACKNFWIEHEQRLRQR